MPCSERIGFSGRSEWFHTEQTITATQIDSETPEAARRGITDPDHSIANGIATVPH